MIIISADLAIILKISVFLYKSLLISVFFTKIALINDADNEKNAINPIKKSD